MTNVGAEVIGAAARTDAHALRNDYLQRVCAALGEYLARGLPMHLHSDGDGDTLEVAFTLDYPDTFHALLEGHLPPPSADGTTEEVPTQISSAK